MRQKGAIERGRRIFSREAEGMKLMYSEAELRGVEVACVDESRPRYVCLECGTSWVPEKSAQGRRARDWWRCPRGCNQRFISLRRPVIRPRRPFVD